jgi:hypothetical protein
LRRLGAAPPNCLARKNADHQEDPANRNRESTPELLQMHFTCSSAPGLGDFAPPGKP